MLRSRRKMRQKEELFQQEIVNSTTIIFLIKTDSKYFRNQSFKKE
jgi:hypothetical protein